MVPYPQAPTGVAAAPSAPGLTHAANTNGIEVGNASVGSGETTSTQTNAIPIERLPNNALNTPAAAAAAATAALAVASAMAHPMQQQPNGQHHPPPHVVVGTTGQQQPPMASHPYTFPAAHPPPHVGAAHVVPAVPPPHPIPASSSETPSVFKNMKLRRGKWTQEEEEYAAYLIQEFEKGTINGCENGCTLRAFLSKKLHCAPMRISKKYAGKSIGKHVFLSRKPGNGMHGMANDGGVDATATLRQLELAFYKSLFQDRDSTPGNIPLSSPYSLAPFMQPAAGAGVPRTMFNHQPLQFPTAAYPTYGQTLPAAAAVPHAIAPAPTLPQPAAPTQGSAVQVPPPGSVHNVWPSSVSNPVGAAPNTVSTQQAKGSVPNLDDTTQQLHQSYVDALNQMQKNYAAAMPSSQSTPQAPQPSTAPPNGPKPASDATKALPHPGATQEVTKAASGAVQYVPAPGAPTSSGVAPIAARPVTHSGSAVSSSSVNSGPAVKKEDGPPSAFSTNPGPQDIPDILSGFDRVAATNAKLNGESQQNGSNVGVLNPNYDETLVSDQYSPPFTSRSFDDFHQLLGKDLMHQPLNIGEEKTGAGNQTVISSDQVRGVPRPALGANSGKPELHFDASDMASSLTADAYAMFAQESALAVSQHSAYCRTEAVPSGSGTPPNGNGQVALEHAPSTGTAAAVIVDDGSSRVAKRKPESPNNVVPNPSSVVNAANLRAHAKAAEQTARKELNSTSQTAQNKGRRVGAPQSYMRRNPHIVSASERSNSDMGTEESESAIGSSRGSGSEDPSDNTSNDSDSNSDEGPCLKKQKTCRHEAERDGSTMSKSRDVFSAVSMDRGSQGAT